MNRRRAASHFVRGFAQAVEPSLVAGRVGSDHRTHPGGRGGASPLRSTHGIVMSSPCQNPLLDILGLWAAAFTRPREAWDVADHFPSNAARAIS